VVAVSQKKKRIALGIDLGIGLGIPAVVMALSYTVQSHRFNIAEGYGCELYIYPSIPSVFIYFMWPLVISLVSSFYGGESTSHPGGCF
jgi:pheromone a factor receptor